MLRPLATHGIVAAKRQRHSLSFYLLSGAGMGMSLADMTRITLFPHEAAAAEAMPGMDMAGMAGMTVQPSGVGPALWLLTAAMWWTMMIAMMAPAAAPTILLYARVHRHAVDEADGAGS